MNKKELTEADIRTKFITPAIVGDDGGKWNVMTQVREEVLFTKGRVIVRGKTVRRGEARGGDYIPYYEPDLPNAAARCKDNNHASGGSMPPYTPYVPSVRSGRRARGRPPCEQRLECMTPRDRRVHPIGWMFVGRRMPTRFGRRIDPLAIVPGYSPMFQLMFSGRESCRFTD